MSMSSVPMNVSHSAIVGTVQALAAHVADTTRAMRLSSAESGPPTVST